MKNLYFILCIFIMFLHSCISETSNKQHSEQNIGFDKIEHYKIHLSEKERQDMLPIPPKLDSTKEITYYDSLKKEIIVGRLNLFKNNDKISELEKIGFKKTQISTSQFESINSILTDKNLKDRPQLKCVHYYQDILVFKFNDTINSVVQICFSCQSIIINTKKLKFNSDLNEEDFENLYLKLNLTE